MLGHQEQLHVIKNNLLIFCSSCSMGYKRLYLVARSLGKYIVKVHNKHGLTTNACQLSYYKM